MIILILPTRLWVCRPPACLRPEGGRGEVDRDRAQGVFPPLRGCAQSRGLPSLGGEDGDTSERGLRLQLPPGSGGEAGPGGEDSQPRGRPEHFLLSLCHLGGQSGARTSQEIITMIIILVN